MPLATPSFNGVPTLFGVWGIEMDLENKPTRVQRESFGGTNGETTTVMGSSGFLAKVRFLWTFDDGDETDADVAYVLFTQTWQVLIGRAVSANLVDNYGVTWPNAMPLVLTPLERVEPWGAAGQSRMFEVTFDIPL